MQPILRLKKVTKSFHQGSQRIEVLNQLELTLEAGEIVSILGQSGSGKSTLLSLLAGLDHPDLGSIEVKGEDLAMLSQDQLSKFRSKNLGIVFQQYHLMSNLTALESVGFPWNSKECETSRNLPARPSSKSDCPTASPTFPRKCRVENANGSPWPAPW